MSPRRLVCGGTSGVMLSVGHVPTSRGRPSWPQRNGSVMKPSRSGRVRAAASVLALAVPLALATASVAVAPTESTVETYPRPTTGIWEISGHGWGHARGMSQVGAQGAATQGKYATEILNAYYPHTASLDSGNPTVRVALTAVGTEGYLATGTGDHRYECNSA